jgi:hypothetical protein
MGDRERDRTVQGSTRYQALVIRAQNMVRLVGACSVRGTHEAGLEPRGSRSDPWDAAAHVAPKSRSEDVETS